MQKSLNQLYKESGTTLSYKDWRKREDEKMASFNGVSPKDSLKNDPSFKKTKEELTKASGYKTDISGDTLFGINKYIIYLGGLVIVGAIAYRIYQKRK